jgi:hypothetical protein
MQRQELLAGLDGQDFSAHEQLAHPDRSVIGMVLSLPEPEKMLLPVDGKWVLTEDGNYFVRQGVDEPIDKLLRSSENRADMGILIDAGVEASYLISAGGIQVAYDYLFDEHERVWTYVDVDPDREKGDLFAKTFADDRSEGYWSMVRPQVISRVQPRDFIRVHDRDINDHIAGSMIISPGQYSFLLDINDNILGSKTGCGTLSERQIIAADLYDLISDLSYAKNHRFSVERMTFDAMRRFTNLGASVINHLLESTIPRHPDLEEADDQAIERAERVISFFGI